MPISNKKDAQQFKKTERFAQKAKADRGRVAAKLAKPQSESESELPSLTETSNQGGLIDKFLELLVQVPGKEGVTDILEGIQAQIQVSGAEDVEFDEETLSGVKHLPAMLNTVLGAAVAGGSVKRAESLKAKEQLKTITSVLKKALGLEVEQAQSR